MTAYEGALLGTLFTFGMTAAGAMCVFLMRPSRRTTPFLSLASGVMIAASIFSLLLPALETAPRPLLLCTPGLILGAAFMLVLEKPLKKHTTRLPFGTALTFASITLHNIPEGMAVGLSFALAARGVNTWAAAAALAIGIGLQNFPEGAAVALPLYTQGMKRGRAFLLGALSGAVEPLFGVAAVLFAAHTQSMLPFLMCFAAGAMLFVTFRETIPAAAREDVSVRPALFTLLGFLIMMCLDVALG